MQDPITSIGGVPLKDVSSYKYLGINLSSMLSFEQAVNNVYLKANKKLFKLKKIRPYLMPYLSSMIYEQFILHLLDYADFVFESII